MQKVTPNDTASIFFGAGATQYGWYLEVEYRGIDFVDGSRDDWKALLTIENGNDELETHDLNHKVMMRTVRKIASKEGKNIPYLSEHVRKECQTLVFKGPDDVDFDAAMADEVIQVAMFGEVVFG